MVTKSQLPKYKLASASRNSAKESIPPKPMLHRAEELINGQRQEDYGDKLQNFSQIAMLWTGLLATKLTSPITPEDVAMAMIQVKLARLAKSPGHKDSILDIAGYAGCYDKLLEEREVEVELSGITVDFGREG